MPWTRSRDRASAPRARGRPRTSPRCSPAAPARCRCSRSPSRGGCAARASAAPCGRRGRPRASTDSADDPPRRLAHVRLARREERGVRPAVAERHAEALRVADDRVGAHLAGRRQQRQRQQVGGDRDEHAGGVRALDDRRAGRATSPRSSGYCSSSPKRRRVASSVQVAGSPISSRMPSGSARPRSTSMRLREAAVRHEEHALLPRRRLLRLQPVEHRHRLGGGGALVEQRGGRDVHAGQVLDHRLEVQQRLEPALRDLRLVRRVGRVPARDSRTRCAGSRSA